MNKKMISNKILRRTVTTLLVAMVCMSFFCTLAFAVVIPSKVTIDGIKYTTIKAKGGNLYPGNYALGADITLTKPLLVCNGIDTDEPTTIILNGYTLTGMENSNEPAIQVSAGSKLIIKDKEGQDGKIVSCYTAVSVDNGSVTLENAEISSCSNCGIDAKNAQVTICGDAKIVNNNVGVNCGEAVYLSLDGNVLISGNKTAVKLSGDTDLSLGNGVTVSGNQNAGILCNLNQKIIIAGLYDESNKMSVELSLFDESGNASDIKLAFPAALKKYKTSFVGCNGKNICAVVNESAGGYVSVESLTCTGHQYSYAASGNSVIANCSVCGSESKISLVIDAYYDAQTTSYFVDSNKISKEIYINLDYWDDYKVQVYPRIVYTNFSTGESGFDAPSDYGAYSAKLVVLSEENNIGSILCETEEVSFSMMCSSHTWEYISNGGYIYAKCKNCGGVLAEAKLTLNNRDISQNSDEHLELYHCAGDQFQSEITVAGNNLGLGTFKVVYGYYQEDGSLKYSFDAPKEDGEYTVKIAVLQRANNPNSVIASTDEVAYSYKLHDWEYSADRGSLHAGCGKCNTVAFVCLDHTEVATAGRAYADNGNGSFNGNVFYEDDWSSAEGIKKYHVLYRNAGSTEYTLDRSILDGNSFYCSAKIVLLNDEKDINSVYLSTEEETFYFATKPEGTFTVAEYNEANMKAPQSESDGSGTTYYIRTADELYWAAKYATSNECICLMNDIVVNPLTLSSDSKKIYSASDTVYTWDGFGSVDNAFSGTILGNGFTISGLYSKDALCSGLIVYGRDNGVYELTIKDSVFRGRCCGGIGAYIIAYNKFSETIINNCKVLNCQIISGSKNQLYCGGGIVGRFNFDIDTCSLVIENCVSDVYINSPNEAGGIIANVRGEPNYYRGLTTDTYYTYITNCVNLGSVYGDSKAGGIVGIQDGTRNASMALVGCRNLGRIESSKAAGGIIGMSHDSENLTSTYFTMNSCTNIGEIYCKTSAIGGLAGATDWKPSGYLSPHLAPNMDGTNNAYYGAVRAVGGIYFDFVYYDTDYNIDDFYHVYDTTGVIKLTRELARKANVCNGFALDGSGNAVKASGTYNHVVVECQTVSSANCQSGGSKVVKCIICGETLDTTHSDAHGHDYLDDTCVYCGAAKENNIASVFSQNANMIYILLGIVVLAFVIVIVLKRRIKQ